MAKQRTRFPLRGVAHESALPAFSKAAPPWPERLLSFGSARAAQGKVKGSRAAVAAVGGARVKHDLG